MKKGMSTKLTIRRKVQGAFDPSKVPNKDR
jgi:hypothetical protein